VADGAEVAKSALYGIHNVSAAVLKGFSGQFDKVLPGTGELVSAGTDALGGIWRAAGLFPAEQAPPEKKPATSTPAGAPPATATTPPAEPPKGSSGSVQSTIEGLGSKLQAYLASKGVQSLPPAPPAEALRTPPPVVESKKVVATEATRPAAADGKRLGL
jgi:hypothetical protein